MLAPATPFGRAAIEAIIPHRDPFLLVDEIVELVPGERVRGRYTVRGDEYFLQGHFPGRPIMPGVLMVEALAQAGCVGVLSHDDFAGKLAVFAGLEGVRFRRLVTPGDTLELELVVDKLRRALGRGTGTVRVGDEVAVEAQLIFGFIDP
ncbi:MAG: 3-hydroxyacyl-[acyl-carrier-protein] dehydratase [Gaiellales bacterium]|jgi:3-hydroxyacyl-[acyl-carrier-protein] dehydratase|nr:3-hydroxyacyl-[acyl-carrier-protein] dehydratase [Gaiellales bacterium]MDX6579378.1 3-hydroxyacyl-[acyl-carrier-protein] dehydratase [Gaiellales bacterium]